MQAKVNHYHESSVTGPAETIDYTDLQSVIAWSQGQIGHPWDGVSVEVINEDGDVDDRFDVEIRDGNYERVIPA